MSQLRSIQLRMPGIRNLAQSVIERIDICTNGYTNESHIEKSMINEALENLERIVNHLTRCCDKFHSEEKNEGQFHVIEERMRSVIIILTLKHMVL